MSKIFLTTLALVISEGTQLRADVLVLPRGAENIEGQQGSSYPFGAPNGRIQQYYPKEEFSSLAPVLEITSVAFRVNNSPGVFHAAFDNLLVRMSTTQLEPHQVGATPMDIWANHGRDRTTVFQGAIRFDSDHPGGNRPASFDIKIPLSTPFLYSPQTGNLLVEVWQDDSTGSGGDLDVFQSNSPLVFGQGFGGIVGEWMLATQFEYRSVPEPSVTWIGTVGLLLLFVAKRKF